MIRPRTSPSSTMTVPDILARTDGHAALTERFAHAVDMIRQAIAPQMLLTDEQQIDAVFFRFLADGFGVLHVRGKYRGRHAETVKNGLRLFDKAFRFGAGHELGEIGLAELVDEVQLAVREQPASAHPRKDMAGVALHAFLGLAERTAALLDHVAALHNAHRQIRMVGQPPSREQPGRAPPTMMTSNVFDIKILQKGWHKRGRQEKARRRGIVG